MEAFLFASTAVHWYSNREMLLCCRILKMISKEVNIPKFLKIATFSYYTPHIGKEKNSP